MAGQGGRGPRPKDPSERRRRNSTPPVEELPAEGRPEGFPLLPARYELAGRDGETVWREYRAETRLWYETWARSPMALKFTGVDWFRLRTIAPLYDAYVRHPSKELMSELRLNESLLGATVADRERMHLKVMLPAAVDRETPAAQASAAGGKVAVMERYRRAVGT